MHSRKQLWTGISSALAMLLFVLDSQTAFAGAKDGITLCIYTVIPSLFPFFVITALISSIFVGQSIPLLRPLGRLSGVPEGGECILLLGLIGGYPVGAQVIADTYRSGQIDQDTAKRLLGFCSNAGPAFLFGMVATQFSSKQIPWLLWGIHVISALIVGLLLPNKEKTTCRLRTSTSVTLPQALEQGIRITASVCGWVVLFRVIIAICQRWFLWLFSQELQAIFAGLLELSNGCSTLRSISSEALRFVFSSCMLAFGGICVGMQTISVTKGIGTGMYFPGKLLQCLVSFLLAGGAQYLVYPDTRLDIMRPLVICTLILAAFLIIMNRSSKKVVALCS